MKTPTNIKKPPTISITKSVTPKQPNEKNSYKKNPYFKPTPYSNQIHKTIHPKQNKKK